MVEWNDQGVLERARQAAMRGIMRFAESVRNESITLILNGEKTGRVYRRGNVEHQASAPGEAPASDTGTLVGRIETSYDEANLSAQVAARTAYAEPLELGTQKMEPRPFLRPALANKLDEGVEMVQEEIDRALG